MDNEQEKIRAASLPLPADEGAGFIAYANYHIKKLQDEGRYDAAIKLKGYIKRFVTYLGKNEIPFKEFDSLLVRNYHTWLENQKLGRNTVSLYVRSLKRVYRLAVADGVTRENHPFDGVDVSYRVKKGKDRLTPREVIRLRYMDISGLHSSAVFARDLFLFAVFTKGMTGRDIFYLTKDSIKDGFLTYTSKVTGKEEAVRWTPFLQETVDKYAQPDTPYLFPLITAEYPQGQWRQHGAAIHNINWNLKKIGRMLGLPFPLNLTVARHTWNGLIQEVKISDLI